MPRGRPKKDDKRSKAYQVLLSGEEDVLFQKLLETLNKEGAAVGAKVTAPNYFRAAITRDVAARGLGKPAKRGSGR